MESVGTIENCVRSLGNCIFSCWNEEAKPIENKNEDREVKIANDASKFSISMDVSHFKPEELRVQLNGREIVIEGNQEKPSDVGYVQKSFMRRWTLPDDADIDAVETNLVERGQLLIEVPKTGQHTFRRELPIKTSAENTKPPLNIPAKATDSPISIPAESAPPSRVIVIN